MTDLIAALDDRALVPLGGEDAVHWLQNLITADIEAQPTESALGAALLTPQGKILFDFLVLKDETAALAIDVRRDQAASLAQRLTFYKLRAKVMIGAPQDVTVGIATSGHWRDLRFGEPVWRSLPDATQSTKRAPYDALRIAHGVAESGTDYALGDAFPHDVNLDQTGGVGFRKGCYVGQEVVSRMQHRGTARRRIVRVEAAADMPPAFTPVLAGDREIGTLGTVQGREGLAMLRLDRLADALAGGKAVTAGGVPVTASLPPGATFTLVPEGGGSDA
ncbi:MAG: folate-binding protein [Rhizobiaceae bacterium]|jgi:hypothetical protein|nr:folate-binding protein [Rhizobiaceae bacterium]